MKAYHKSTASIGAETAREWCCVSGTEENSDADAIECARSEYGGDWIMPVFTSERPADWPRNPKMSWDGKRMLWLLVKG